MGMSGSFSSGIPVLIEKFGLVFYCFLPIRRVFVLKIKKFFYSQKVAPYVFVVPFVLSFLIFWIYPLISSVTMSFQDIGAVSSEWIGVKNYTKLLKDKVFITAVVHDEFLMNVHRSVDKYKLYEILWEEMVQSIYLPKIRYHRWLQNLR